VLKCHFTSSHGVPTLRNKSPSFAPHHLLITEFGILGQEARPDILEQVESPAENSGYNFGEPEPEKICPLGVSHSQ
jgi:hypothetical protein